MCGIFGSIGGPPLEPRRVERAMISLAHRGPDKQDTVVLPGVRLGHTLLSIIGDSPVPQPIRSLDGRGALVFNGEIYNYLELMEDDAVLRGICRRRERSDSVVLVEGMRLYGDEFLQRLNGMFAFAYHDLDTGSTTLVRDRLGIKPLFYSRVVGGMVFASETRTVRLLTGLPFQPDPEGFYSYLRFRYPIMSRSFDRRIRQLMPGHLLRVAADGEETAVRWWTNLSAGGFDGSYEDALTEVEALLHSAIELRMRSDHDFSTFLSGGLDSSVLATVASRTKERLDTYSIGICGAEEFDESAFAGKVVEQLGTHHHPYMLGPEEFTDQHRAMVDELEEPLGVPNQVAIKVLSRGISETHRVVLSGEGADEIFAGYGRIFLLPHDWELIGQNRVATAEVREKLERRYGKSMPESFVDLFLQRYGYTPHKYAVEALRPWMAGVDGEALRESVEGDVRRLHDALDADTPFNRMLLLFQNLHLPGLLYRVDAATMAHSVEARVPFLDHRLLAFVNTLPIEYKVRPIRPLSELTGLVADEISEVHDIPKVMLKDIGRKMLPLQIVERRKMGFPIPSSFYSEGQPEGAVDYKMWTQRNLELLAEAV